MIISWRVYTVVDKVLFECSIFGRVCSRLPVRVRVQGAGPAGSTTFQAHFDLCFLFWVLSKVSIPSLQHSKDRTNCPNAAQVWATTPSKALKLFDLTVFNVTLCALLWGNGPDCPSVELSKRTTTERHPRKLVPELWRSLAPR